MPFLPRDRVVVVTGASAGIGRETALAFARDGARVAIGARNGPRLAQVAREIDAFGGHVLARPCDVRNPDDVKGLVDAARRQFGAIDVLINNAGVGVYGTLESVSVEDYDAVMKTNLEGPFFAIREVIPIMKAQRRGQIINVTSTLGRIGMPLMSIYCMSKFALEALSQSLRVELKPHGIDVIVVAPGVTLTEFNYNAKVRGMRKNPAADIGGRVTPDRVARAILRASRKRKREVVLNLDSKAMLALHRLFPRFTDWALGKWMKKKYEV